MKYAVRLFCISVIGTASAFAHEVLTHQNIGNVAVAYLQQSAPSRPALPSLQQLLLIGAVQEDNDPLPGLPFPLLSRIRVIRPIRVLRGPTTHLLRRGSAGKQLPSMSESFPGEVTKRAKNKPL